MKEYIIFTPDDARTTKYVMLWNYGDGYGNIDLTDFVDNFIILFCKRDLVEIPDEMFDMLENIYNELEKINSGMIEFESSEFISNSFLFSKAKGL